MTMTDWICALAAAMAAGTLAWGLVPWASRHGLVDRPSGRHDHAAPTPVVGGVAVFLGVAVVGLVGGAADAGFVAWLIAGALLVGVGILDDLHGLSWRLRVLVQAFAAVVLFAGGAYADSVGNLFDLGIWSLPFSVFATVGVINAVNMIDGSDGLSGTQVGIALAFFAFEASRAGDPALAAQCLLLLGGVSGFLVHNLRYKGQPAARVFLGNSGSALLGLTIAWAAFRLAGIPGNDAAGILAPWLIAIPLIDCVTVMVRRLLDGRSPFAADRNHIHHLLRDAGYSPQHIVALTAATSLAAGLGANLWLGAGRPELPLVLVFLGVIAGHFAWSSRRERAVAQLRRMPKVSSPYRGESMPPSREFHD